MRRFLFILTLSVITFFHGIGQFKDVTPAKTRIEFNGKFPSVLDIKNQKPISSYKPHYNQRLHLSSGLQGPLKINTFSPQSGSAWVTGQSRQAVSVRNSSIADKTVDYLIEVYETTTFHKPDLNVDVIESSVDELGILHVQFRQKLYDLPIFNSESYVHGQEDFTSFNGRIFIFSSEPDDIPELSMDDAVYLVEKDLHIDVEKRHDRLNPTLTSEEKNELGYYEDNETIKLAYHLEIHKNIIEKWEYFIDAKSGEILSKFPTICKFHNHATETKMDFDGPSVSNANDLFGDAKQINTYNVENFFFMIDATRSMYNASTSNMPNEPVGVIWTIDAFETSPENEDFQYGHVFSNNNNWTGQENAVSAHYNAGKAFEYFKTVHGRESINGQGGNIISLVNISDKDGKTLENAFWNGAAMFYGSGGQAFLPLARGLDVAAHEMSHGVIQNTANLTYQGESGAINESMADIFGAMVDRDDWLIGEDVIVSSAFPSGALRNLQDPHNGAAQGDYNNGFQPKHVNEQYLGNADNGGVHINSGIPNHAYYLFASSVGKEKAEQIYFRALERYLVKSSKFIDLRLAVIQAANDLDTDGNGAEVAAAASAFDQVGITDGTGGNYQQDLEVNNGNDFILATSSDRSQLNLYNGSFQYLFTLFDGGVINKPSISDDGEAVFFVGGDNKIYVVFFNWDTGMPTIGTFDNNPIWRNAIISKDNSKFAALYNDESNRIFVYDFASQSGVNFELYNPTFTQGVVTNNVDFADAMEFDYSGNYIMYDAKSTFPSTDATPIVVWDIGFLKIWNEQADTWSLGTIEKLFTNLPEGTSVGNPVFAKNSPYIITFDRRNEKEEYFLMGANIETGELNTMVQNSFWNVPNFAVDDQKIIVDVFSNGVYNLFTVDLDASKINTIPQSGKQVLGNSRWGLWFANGERNLNTAVDELERISVISLYPNPTSDMLNLEVNLEESGSGSLQIFGNDGRLFHNENINIFSGKNNYSVDIGYLPSGTYLARIMTGNKAGIKLFIKQ